MPQILRLRLVPAALLLAGLGSIAGCNTVTTAMSDGLTSIITPYRVEVVQGNVVTREQIAAIKPGLPRTRVRDVLGSPLVADPFHAQRWDYVFLIRRPGTEPQQRSVVVLFEGDVVKSVEAPELPSEREFVASISRPASTDKEPKLELTPEERQALPPPAKVAATEATNLPLGAVRPYPPLEPQ
ncbi:MAG: outer membrane protein assembly factor BamE [Vitreoscilla sp.]|nr:outer membrane protein assembly factor BamE [Vitreoscilla sp.]